MIPDDSFAGPATPLNTAGVERATGLLHVGRAELWAVLKVETSGCGFFADRRPQMLFERHIFHRETGGRFDATFPDISDSSPGGYTRGAREYDRLARAIACDREAALRSASWGLGQVMGFNFEVVGFADVGAMVAAMVLSESNQLLAMARFIVGHNLDVQLREHDWVTFARGYNGPAFAKNHYDTKLAQAFVRYSVRGLPDLRVRAAQLRLMYRGYHPGPIDGEMGARTRAALRDFQSDVVARATGELDDLVISFLGSEAA